MVNACGAEAVRARCVESVWEDFGSSGMLAANDKIAATPGEIFLPVDSWQKDLKQVMLRTDWSHEALSVFFACRTPVNNAHAHIDPMSFDFTAHGRPLIIDPGRFTYREDADRRDFKSAVCHNTLIINEREPFAYLGSWEYGGAEAGGYRGGPSTTGVQGRHRAP